MMPCLLNEAFSAKITIIIYKRVFCAAVNTYIGVYRCTWRQKNYEQAHTHTRDNHSNDNNKIIRSAEAHTVI